MAEKMEHLKKLESKLSMHVNAGQGKNTEPSLREKAEQYNLRAADHYHKADPEYADRPPTHREATHHENAGDFLMEHAKDHERMANLMSSAKDAVKKYGSGHDMAHHGEGKPHGG